MNREHYDFGADPDEYPEDDDFLFKRARHSQLIDSKKILENDNLNLSNHVYNTPGIKTIKIIKHHYLWHVIQSTFHINYILIF